MEGTATMAVAVSRRRRDDGERIMVRSYGP
jgi:hypothetical protein